MYMIMFTSSMHGIVVLSSLNDDMHGMSQYDGVLPYMHNVGLSDYMKKVLLGMYEVSLLALLMYDVNDMLFVS